jgi:membrane protein DedA with SNARE-associated domain
MMSLGDRYFAKHGARTIFIGRWIAWIRFAVAWLAGINHVPFGTFFTWNALGAITWGTTYGLVGYLGGAAVANVVERFGIYAGIVLVVAILSGWIFLSVRERRRATGP